MKVLIVTRCNKTLQSESDGTKRIEWSNASDRKWLVNHLHWAMHNNKIVDLSPESN